MSLSLITALLKEPHHVMVPPLPPGLMVASVEEVVLGLQDEYLSVLLVTQCHQAVIWSR